MRIFLMAALTSFAAAMLPLNAQDAANIDLQATPPPPKAPPTVTPAVNLPERSQIDEIFRQTSLGKEADERRLHLEWRELSNRVVNNGDIVAAKKSAELAGTDLEKRQRLRAYYELYYGRLRSLASSAEMRAALDQLKMAHLSQINQPRVRHETDEGLPTPTPQGKHKHKNG